MPTYNISSINYYRINQNNTVIAQSASGNTGGPTEELVVPISAGGTFSSYNSGTLTVNGNGTNFNDLDEGQYLYYLDTSSSYKLIGQIATISSASAIVLTESATNIGPSTANRPLYGSFSLLTTNEQIYMRIATDLSTPNQVGMPLFGLGGWRLNNNITGRNNPAMSQILRVSAAGIPLTPETLTVDVPFTFVVMNTFPISAGSTASPTAYFRTATDFPTYLWIKVTATPISGSTKSFNSQTMYTFITQQLTQSITAVPNTPTATLRNAGYDNVSSSAGTTTGPTN